MDKLEEITTDKFNMKIGVDHSQKPRSTIKFCRKNRLLINQDSSKIFSCCNYPENLDIEFGKSHGTCKKCGSSIKC